MTEDILQIQAAHALKPGWDNYKPTAKAALRDESTQIQQWLEYVAANADQQQALQTLGLTQIVQELEQYNNQVIQLMDERAAERQQRKAVVISDERRAADRKADKAGGLYLALTATLATLGTAAVSGWEMPTKSQMQLVEAKLLSDDASLSGAFYLFRKSDNGIGYHKLGGTSWATVPNTTTAYRLRPVALVTVAKE